MSGIFSFDNEFDWSSTKYRIVQDDGKTFHLEVLRHTGLSFFGGKGEYWAKVYGTTGEMDYIETWPSAEKAKEFAEHRIGLSMSRRKDKAERESGGPYPKVVSHN